MIDAIGMEYKKQRLALGLAVGLAATVQLQGCTTIQEKIQSTAEEHPLIFCGMGSMVTGGAVWAGCHYLLQGNTAGCVIGAVAAGVADGLSCWWQLKQKIVDDYDDTRKKLHYDPSQGYLVKIVDFSATPQIARPGDEVKIRAKFALMSPNPTDEIKFERKITLPGDSKPRTEIITYQPGTWGIEDYPFKIDASAPDGKVELTLELRLLDHNKSDRHTLCFNVVHGVAQPAPGQLCSSSPSGGNTLINPAAASGLTEQFVASASAKDRSVRDLPKAKAHAIGSVRGGQHYPLLEKYEKGSQVWYRIQLDNGETGWISSKAGTLE